MLKFTAAFTQNDPFVESTFFELYFCFKILKKRGRCEDSERERERERERDGDAKTVRDREGERRNTICFNFQHA